MKKRDEISSYHYMSISMPSAFFDAWYKEHPVEPTDTDEVH